MNIWTVTYIFLGLLIGSAFTFYSAEYDKDDIVIAALWGMLVGLFWWVATLLGILAVPTLIFWYLKKRKRENYRMNKKY